MTNGQDKMTNEFFVKKLKPGPEADLEIELQNIASKQHGFAPQIRTVQTNQDEVFLVMDNLGTENTLYNIYGDQPEALPKHVWCEIRRIVTTLLEVEGIEYIDVTSYNFLEKDDKIWIIDFGHARYTRPDQKKNWFLEDFLDGWDSWNPDMA